MSKVTLRTMAIVLMVVLLDGKIGEKITLIVGNYQFWGLDDMLYEGILEENTGLGGEFYISDPINGDSPIQDEGYPCEVKCIFPDGSVVWRPDRFSKRISSNISTKPTVKANIL